MRDYPVTAWFVLAVALVILNPVVPHAAWLLIHVLMLGAATHSVMVWSTYFAQALLKTPDSLDPRTRQNARLWILFAGTVVVLVGVPSGRWEVTAGGAGLVVVAVTWHASALLRRLRVGLPSRFRVTVHYYLASAAWLVVGAVLGSLLATEPGESWTGRLLVAHTLAMGLGWLGLAIAGSLVTLWPTMLRTRMDDRAEALAERALPVFVVALAVTVGGACLGSRPLIVLGLWGYLAAALWWGRALARPARRHPPHQFSTVSVTAGLLWFLAVPPAVAVAVLRMPDWAHLEDGYRAAAVAVVGGFVGQVLLGAMSFLVPAAIGGGPSVVRTAHVFFDRWAVPRVLTWNAGLLCLVLPVDGALRAAGLALAGGAVAVFAALAARAVLAMARARGDLERRVREGEGLPRPGAAPGITSVWSWRGVAVGAAVVAVVLVGAAVTSG